MNKKTFGVQYTLMNMKCSRNKVTSSSQSTIRIVSYSLVYVDDSVAGWTTMFHIFTGIDAERDTAADKTPKEGEAATDSPGHQACCVLCLGDHCMLAVGTHRLSWDVMQCRPYNHVSHCCGRCSWACI